MQELKEIPMDQKHKEEFIDIFNRTREDMKKWGNLTIRNYQQINAI